MKRLLLFALITLVIGACGDTDRPDPVRPGVSGSSSVPGGGGKGGQGGRGGQATSSGAAGEAGSSGEGGAAGEESGTPEVSITSPAGAESPSDEAVLVQNEVSVLCSVKPADQPDAPAIDPSSVSIELLNSDGDVLHEAPGLRTDNADEYGAEFVMVDVPSGPISFRCSGSSRSAPPLTGQDTLATLVDRGPIVEVQDPLPDSVHALLGEVAVEFAVEPVPLADEDEGAAIDEVTLEVNGVEFEVDQVSDTPLTYRTSIDFTDRNVFADVLMGSVPVIIRASNGRQPEPAVSTLAYGFTLDGAAPVIQIESPAADVVIGGKEVNLKFSVTDALTAIQPNTVGVRLNTVQYRYGSEGNWTRNGNVYTFTFDSTQVTGSQWQVTVNIEAEDVAGNVARASRNFYLDNVPPILDLDPLEVQEVKRNNQCSDWFDPLGVAVNDGDIVSPAPLIRAFVWDLTNGIPGSDAILHHSGPNRSSIELFLQPDLTAEFLTDEDGDLYCDAINTTGLHVQNLRAINPQGTAKATAFTPSPDPVSGCVSSNNDPQPLCGLPRPVRDFTRVIDRALSGTEPVIYGVGALLGLECTGANWEILPLVEREGWVCLAAQGRDNAGNLGVSPPLRVCIDDGFGDAPDCSPEAMPACTDGCLPRRLDALRIAID